MNIVKIKIKSDIGKQKELFHFCQMITDQVRQKTGCSSSCVLQNQNSLRLEQQWEHFNLLENYFRSDQFTALLGAMKFLGKSYEITINGSTGKEGMVIVENARTINN
jgi:quinol monooxygenase YgiN